jgi:hypothetical protein
MAADAKIDLEKALFHASFHIDPFQTDNSSVECHRDPPPGSADIPVSHREDPWAEHPDAGARCRAQPDWTAAAADTACPGAISGRSRCTVDKHGLVVCLVLFLL